MGRNWRPKKRAVCPKCGWTGLRVAVTDFCPKGCGVRCREKDFSMTPTPSASKTASADAGEGEASHTPKCWGRTSYSDEMTHCYCAKPSEADALAALLDNLVIAQSLSKELREQALNQAQSYLYDRRQRLAALRQTSSEPVAWRYRWPEWPETEWAVTNNRDPSSDARNAGMISQPLGVIAAPEHAASERVRVLEEALREIAERPMSIEKNTVDGTRERCPSCAHAWPVGGKVHHSERCDRIIALAALNPQSQEKGI